MRITSIVALLFTTLFHLPTAAQERPRGIQGEVAPQLGVTEWIQLPEGKEKIELSEFRGKTVIMLFFQHTCTACNKRALPTLQKLLKKFGDSDAIAFLAIQTPFEDFSNNTVAKLEVTAARFDLDIPIGHLAKRPGAHSLNAAYKTAGTPWWVIVNPEGVVDYNGFYLNPEEAEKNIENLIAGKPIN